MNSSWHDINTDFSRHQTWGIKLFPRICTCKKRYTGIDVTANLKSYRVYVILEQYNNTVFIVRWLLLELKNLIMLNVR